MKNEKEKTAEKIKNAAVNEFLKNGYSKASLRKICQSAGVTTGAMYFSFESKEALFKAIFEPLIRQYEELLRKYMRMELEEPDKGVQLDLLMMQFILEHRKEAIIILDKAEGSCYEDYRLKVEGMMEQSFKAFYGSKLESLPDDKLIKILAKIRLDGCIEIIKGNYDMEYSMYLAEKIGIYSTGGTEKLIQNLKELHSN